jgi:hypothetical protein
MIEADYIEPGRYADPNGNGITVTDQTPDGRYNVAYPGGAERVLSSGTIRRLYPLAAAVLALALLPAMAFGATPKQVRKAEAAVKHQTSALASIFGGGTPVRVACHSTSAIQIACVVTGAAGRSGGSTSAGETFTVTGGKLHGSGLESPAPASAASVRSPWKVRITNKAFAIMNAQGQALYRPDALDNEEPVVPGTNPNMGCEVYPQHRQYVVCDITAQVETANGPASATYNETFTIAHGQIAHYTGLKRA